MYSSRGERPTTTDLRACSCRARAVTHENGHRLVRRPYDLRHTAPSLWLNASGAPAEAAARAETSARVLDEVYPALHRQQVRPRQPAGRRRPRCAARQPTAVTARDSKRLYAPSAAARTLSAICT